MTWGHPSFGGNCRNVQEQLRNVRQIQATAKAFAAILENGSVVTWGSEEYGGSSSSVHAQLMDVRLIQASNAAFAAIREDGTVLTWGDDNYGGDSSQAREQLKAVHQVQASIADRHGSFAASLDDGSVVSWGRYAMQYIATCSERDAVVVQRVLPLIARTRMVETLRRQQPYLRSTLSM